MENRKKIVIIVNIIGIVLIIIGCISLNFIIFLVTVVLGVTFITAGKIVYYWGEHLENKRMITQQIPQKLQRICPKCSKQITFDANVCPYCGHKF